jgi:hypothetical protein
MHLDYPADFPQTLRGAIDAKLEQAEIDFEEAAASNTDPPVETALQYADACMFALLEGQIAAAEPLGWMLERVDKDFDFLTYDIIHDAWTKSYMYCGLDPRDEHYESFEFEYWKRLKRLPQWKQYRKGRLALAQSKAKTAGELTNASAVRAEKTLHWGDVEIEFLSDERITTKIGTDCQTFNYAEFGCEDRRNGVPNKAWGVLRSLAESKGLIDTKSYLRREKVEKRMQEVRKVLRTHFRISDDPIPFIEGEYQAQFKIFCACSQGV